MTKCINSLQHSMGMNARQRAAAKKAVDRLMSHPITAMFCDTSSPVSLPAVAKRAADGQYDSLDAWAADIDAVWESVARGSANDSTVLNAISFCKKLLERERRRIEELNVARWCARITELKQKHMNLMITLPDVVRRVVAEDPEYKAIEAADLMGMEPMTEKQLKRFMSDANAITDEAHLAEMLYMVKDRQPEIDCRGTEVWIDLTKLKYRTVWALSEYMKGVLEPKPRNNTEPVS